MNIWVYTIASVVLVSTISLVGIVLLSLQQERLNRIILFLVSFAVGALFGDAFIHLLPETFEELGVGLPTTLSVIGGVLLFFIIEKFFRWRHCHLHLPNHVHDEPMPHIAMMNLLGDGIHNFIDGMLIAASYSISVPIGITTTIAVMLHEIPQEIGDFGVLVHGGLSARRAVIFNAMSAATAILGAIITLSIGVYIKDALVYLLPITAGGFIYIAGSDLIPELQHEVKVRASFLQFISMLLGITVMVLFAMFE